MAERQLTVSCAGPELALAICKRSATDTENAAVERHACTAGGAARACLRRAQRRHGRQAARAQQWASWPRLASPAQRIVCNEHAQGALRASRVTAWLRIGARGLFRAQRPARRICENPGITEEVRSAVSRPGSGAIRPLPPLAAGGMLHRRCCRPLRLPPHRRASLPCRIAAPLPGHAAAQGSGTAARPGSV